jgi:hypothetical protein
MRGKIHLGIGRWRQRNGNLAEIAAKVTLRAKGPGGEFPFDVWQGRCLHCNSKMTWNLDGRWAGVGEHPFDLVAKEPQP